ncbi:MAG TPA: hypothetical protein PKK20_00500 [Verrucomicrobiota bacterium]|nr:hypothetical protein [Verrucomicrobiota bacterium]NMD20605.1 hypothetical protein [Verrucomicrobiota bacterium]HNU98402.1 hypothetical protein [Verrucomicrobiota bacterium]HOA61804.1 hypothetical protein [Verrucomicrobiota bacterium]HOF49325.1 hypothetical protein [Verrucomicrobiota bacterium]
MNRRTFVKRTAGVTAGLLTSDRLFAASPVSPTGAAMPTWSFRPPLSLEASLRLAGQNLLAILNPEDNYLPYWELSVSPRYEAALKRWWPAHNIGRWLDAMLRLRQVMGFDIPEPIEKAMVENTKRFFDNPDHISLNPDRWPLHPHTTEEGLQWDLHSLREGLLALNALARWHQSDWAADTGRKMIQSVDAKLRDDGRWELEQFDACRKRGKQVIHNTAPCDTHGRMIEAVIWFFETTGDPVALRFAHRLAEYHFANTTQPDGEIPASAQVDHTHSYLGTLRGLLLYGRLTRQQKYLERVAAAYRVNIPRLVKESGYTSHNILIESFGETTSPGDAAQLALWLARAGNAEFLDDVDRLVRARILPSQIRETPSLHPISRFGKDATRDLEKRIIGGYGGCHNHPHGHKVAVTDVTAADVHTLLDIYEHMVLLDDQTLEVFCHLDYDGPHATVLSRRGQRAELTVIPKIERAVAIRAPRWTPVESIRVRVGGDLVHPVYAGHFARLGRQPAGTRIVMEYDLPERRTRETDLGSPYEIAWRGDEVTGVRPNTTLYPFYPELR